ncbi:alpha/beta fold hydrolase [Sphaerisporangium perillae]|uniref:alpha/beta fold hydrolase n=1 Tax=Sphaerisporangium perillae TaxID=2935860 RepID=UPI00200F13AA|nr:alpha/beta fold hydrolase [Sphaerisporangium perillae]
MREVRLVAAGIVAVTMIMSLQCPPVPAQAGASAQSGPVRRASVSEDDQACQAGASCGALRVPLDWDDPAAGTTTVGYMLVHRRDRSRPAEGTIVPNPGGPGVPVIGRRNYARDYSALLDTHDLLLVDPRGVGRSSPLTCRSAGWADLTGTRGRAVAAAAACGREIGARRRFYTTAAAADDIDAVRAHLGIGRLDLLGQSYGTYLMTVYARRHPRHVRSIVLSAAYPLDFDTLGRPTARAMRRSVRLLCHRSYGECDGTEVLEDLAVMARRLDRRPIRYAGGAVLDETALASTVYKLASGHVDLFGGLPEALRAAVDGDPGPLVELAERVRPLSGLSAGLSAGRAGVSASDVTGVSGRGAASSMPMFVTVVCNDYPTLWNRRASVPRRFAQYDARVARLDPHDYRPFSPSAWLDGVVDLGDLCIGWPDHRAPVRQGSGRMPDVPVLVLSGELDTSTPTEEGVQAAAQFRDAEVVEMPSTGHVAEKDGRAKACAIHLETQFIRRWHLTDTRCLRRIPPVEVGPPDRPMP